MTAIVLSDLGDIDSTKDEIELMLSEQSLTLTTQTSHQHHTNNNVRDESHDLTRQSTLHRAAEMTSSTDSCKEKTCIQHMKDALALGQAKGDQILAIESSERGEECLVIGDNPVEPAGFKNNDRKCCVASVDMSGGDSEDESPPSEHNHRHTLDMNSAEIAQQDDCVSPVCLEKLGHTLTDTAVGNCLAGRRDEGYFKFHLRSTMIQRGARNNMFQCDICDSLFTKPLLLKKHYLRLHINKLFHPPKDEISDVVDADVPGYNFTISDCADGMDESGVGLTGLYCCHLCAKLFDDIQPLRHHMDGHTEELPYKCTECGRRFAHRQNMILHKTTHTAQKETVKSGKPNGDGLSVITGDTGNQIKVIPDGIEPADDKVHEFVKEKNEESPPDNAGEIVVGETGNDQTDQSQMKNRSRNEPTSSFVCDICSRTFTRMRHLKLHRKFHFKTPAERKNRRLKNPDGTSRRKIIHCEVCGKPFLTQGNLRRHRLLAHGIETPPETTGTTTTTAEQPSVYTPVNTTTIPISNEVRLVDTEYFSNGMIVPTPPYVFLHTPHPFTAVTPQPSRQLYVTSLPSTPLSAPKPEYFKPLGTDEQTSRSLITVPGMHSFGDESVCLNKGFDSSTISSCIYRGKCPQYCQKLQPVAYKKNGLFDILRVPLPAPSTPPSSIAVTEKPNSPKCVAPKPIDLSAKNLKLKSTFTDVQEQNEPLDLTKSKYDLDDNLDAYLTKEGCLDLSKTNIMRSPPFISPVTLHINFPCNVCDAKFNSMKSLSKHIHCHAIEWPYKCEFCLTLFQSPYYLLQHRFEAHRVNVTHTCPECQQEFAYRANLVQHVNDLHPFTLFKDDFEHKFGTLRPQNYTNYTLYSRLIMDSVNTTDTVADLNIFKTDRLNPSGGTCTKCGSVFDDKAALHAHIFDVCGKDILQKSEHMLSSLDNSKKYQDDKSKSKRKLSSEYNQNVAPRKNSILYPLKPKTVTLSPGKKSHKVAKNRKEEDNLQLPAEEADTTLPPQNISSTKQCQACGKPFNFVVSLAAHLRRCPARYVGPNEEIVEHQMEILRPIIQLKKQEDRKTNGTKAKKCPYCDKSFVTAIRLKKHTLKFHPDASPVSELGDSLVIDDQQPSGVVEGLDDQTNVPDVPPIAIDNLVVPQPVIPVTPVIEKVLNKPAHKCQHCHKNFITLVRFKKHLVRFHSKDGGEDIEHNGSGVISSECRQVGLTEDLDKKQSFQLHETQTSIKRVCNSSAEKSVPKKRKKAEKTPKMPSEKKARALARPIKKMIAPPSGSLVEN